MAGGGSARGEIDHQILFGRARGVRKEARGTAAPPLIPLTTVS